MNVRKKIAVGATGALTVAAVTGLFSGLAFAATPSTPGISSNPSHLAGSVAGPIAAEAGEHACAGKNGCSGQGGCKSGDNGCKGKNSCKGKGGCATDGSHDH